MEKYFELIHKTPYWDKTFSSYDPGKERIQEAIYVLDLWLRKLKPSL